MIHELDKDPTGRRIAKQLKVMTEQLNKTGEHINANTGIIGASGITGEQGIPRMSEELDAHIMKYLITFNAYKTIVNEQMETLARKSHDYGMDNINLGLDTSDPKNRHVAAQAVIVRMLDKMNRLKQLVLLNSNPLVNDESVIDTLKDLANYAVIAQLVLDGKWGK